MDMKLFEATTDERLNLIKKRLYQSSSINNLGDTIYDFTARNDVEYLLEQIIKLEAELARYKQAEDEGRLVTILDIKYNKTMYLLIDNQIATVLYKGKPWGNVLSSEKIFKVYYNMTFKKDIILSSGHTIKKGDKICFGESDIGKIVFLTKQQAEQARGVAE